MGVLSGHRLTLRRPGAWLTAVVLAVSAVASAALAADRARVVSVTLESRPAGTAVVVKADAPLSSSTTTTAGTIVVRLPGALLPTDLPVFQSVSDTLISSMTTQQTSTEPPNALLAFALRAPAVANVARSDDGKSLTITFTASGGVSGTTPAPLVTGPGVEPLRAAPVAPAAATTTTIVQLRSALPAVGSAGGSSTPNDIATTLTTLLGASAPDLRVVVPPNSTMLAISGSPASIRAAIDLLRQLDVPSTQVVLDTAVYEIDENAARNVGLQLPNGAVTTTFSEVTPGGQFASPSPNVGIQALSRTPINFTAQINLLLSNGKGRVLANPRVTTVSGRVATIRAGDNIPFVQTNSSPIGGTISQTVLTFQTGVTLDITPIVESDGRVSVTLHPIVNTLTGITQQGVPLISSREAQTTVDLRDGETVVIGGLIQENTVSTVSKIPGVGDLPLVGGLFRNSSRTTTRSELVIIVTPHVVAAGAAPAIGSPAPALPTPQLAPRKPQ